MKFPTSNNTPLIEKKNPLLIIVFDLSPSIFKEIEPHFQPHCNWPIPVSLKYIPSRYNNFNKIITKKKPFLIIANSITIPDENNCLPTVSRLANEGIQTLIICKGNENCVGIDRFKCSSYQQGEIITYEKKSDIIKIIKLKVSIYARKLNIVSHEVETNVDETNVDETNVVETNTVETNDGILIRFINLSINFLYGTPEEKKAILRNLLKKISTNKLILSALFVLSVLLITIIKYPCILLSYYDITIFSFLKCK
ncbi:MAG: hypothetical protein HQL68_03790 [Magnetococcales bacterium]|nr:hypothetical protein [Magnetococcales bacterium]